MRPTHIRDSKMKKLLKTLTVTVGCIVMTLLVSCKKDKVEPSNNSSTQTVATVTTNEVTSITSTTAVCGGEVKSENGWKVTERGVCWGTESNPTPSDSHTVSGEGLGKFTSEMTGMIPNTKYYVRAYATNAAGTSFGQEKSFTTQAGGGGSANLPVVTTTFVSSITVNSAISGGNITSDGGAAITARGVCWSTNQDPTTNDVHTTDGNGTGSFTSEMTGLAENTTYYVRAYATNGNGTAYGSQQVFTTSQGGGSANLPTVTTTSVTNITESSATCVSNVTNDGGALVTLRGACWSTNQDPTTDDPHTTNGSGTGSFTSEMTGLAENTTYYVRAYAVNEAGTAYGNVMSFTTESSQPGGPAGALNGLFTVDGSKQIYFSQGNLQYIGSVSTPYWKFADNQWDYLGTATGQNSSYESVDRDLFGWGTSGYDYGAWNYHPWETTEEYVGYGPYLSDLNGQSDWGYNAISNGGNTEGQWRTPSSEDWDFLFNFRPTQSGIRYAKAQITDINGSNSVNGVILLPNDWLTSYYDLNQTNDAHANFDSNVISVATWIDSFETNGAVFLPAAGSRNVTAVYGTNEWGQYWTSSYNGQYSADALHFSSSSWEIYANYQNRGYGYAVRLIKDAE